jgi:D-alanine-D-alanine ligase
MDLGKVIVLMGGEGPEREVSLSTGNTVLAALKRQNVNVQALDATAGFVHELLRQQPSRVFIALHGTDGENGNIQGLLETLRIPYTGSSPLASVLGMHKMMAKRLWQAAGLPTPPACILHTLNDINSFIDVVGFPIAIKPVNQGSSVGVSKITSRAELEQAFHKAAQYGTVMAEQWISGDEYAFGILGDIDLPPIQIVVPTGEFYDYQAKYHSDSTQYLLDNDLDEREKQHAQGIARHAFQAINASALGRVDMLRDANGDFWLLEVNTVPGLTDHSLLPMAARAYGIDIDTLVMEILQSSCLSTVSSLNLLVGHGNT